MSSILFFTTIAACLITAIFLMIGLGQLFKKTQNPQKSQKMMQMRIFFQTIALALMAIMLWIKNRGGF
jgi:hypothetical protein